MEYLFEYTGQEREARKLLIDEKIAPFDSVDDYKRRKWSRIRKVKHRNKKAVNKEIK